MSEVTCLTCYRATRIRVPYGTELAQILHDEYMAKCAVEETMRIVNQAQERTIWNTWFGTWPPKVS
jgi:hypothetical protein